MPIEATNSAHFMVGPLVAIVVMVLLAGIMRWIWAPKRRMRSLEETDYGLLAEVARMPRREQALLMRDRLGSEGIRATVAPAPAATGEAGADGAKGRRAYVVLVFPGDEHRARAVVGQ